MITIIGPSDLGLSIKDVMENYKSPKLRESKDDEFDGTFVEYKNKH